MFLGLGAITSFFWKRVRDLEKLRTAQEFFSRRLLESQEAERWRISAELHDGLGQNLVLMKNLVALQQLGGANEKSSLRTAEIAAATDRALEEVHAISYALRPPPKWIALAWRRRSLRWCAVGGGVRNLLQNADRVRRQPAGNADIQVFRIAQEAVSNVVKHSEARNARVEFWRDEAGAHLVVADDGRGLTAEKRETFSGNGPGFQALKSERACSEPNANGFHHRIRGPRSVCCCPPRGVS